MLITFHLRLQGKNHLFAVFLPSSPVRTKKGASLWTCRCVGGKGRKQRRWIYISYVLAGKLSSLNAAKWISTNWTFHEHKQYWISRVDGIWIGYGDRGKFIYRARKTVDSLENLSASRDQRMDDFTFGLTGQGYKKRLPKTLLVLFA